MSERELIGGKYYLIDEEKCLYRSTEDDGIYYREKGARMFSRHNQQQEMIFLIGQVLQ